MMGSGCIDLSLTNIWRSWYLFKKGKRKTAELDNFAYYLERHLTKLHQELVQGTYQHGSYTRFRVVDKKRRDICVASIRDRVVHRLLYEYLNSIYDKTFIYDAWSCRKGKGLAAAIERTQAQLGKYPSSFVWRADITKFFDSVDQPTLLTMLRRRITNQHALYILSEIIGSYRCGVWLPYRKRAGESHNRPVPIGMPIGNLTSQIFANIYFNEFDRYVKHWLKPLVYIRYGDDFVLVANSKDWLAEVRQQASIFLQKSLRLTVNARNDIIVPARRGLHYLGVDIFPSGRRLQQRTWQRAASCLSISNAASYSGLVSRHGFSKAVKNFQWLLWQKIEEGYNDIRI